MLHSSVILADVWRDITPLALRTYLWQRRYVEFDRLENFRIATKSVLVCKFNTSFFTLASSVSLSSRFHRLYQQSTLFFPLNGCLFFFPFLHGYRSTTSLYTLHLISSSGLPSFRAVFELPSTTSCSPCFLFPCMCIAMSHLYIYDTISWQN